MRKTSIIGIAILFICGLSTQEIMARGFGGGGGRGGGGGGAFLTAAELPTEARP